MSTRALLVASLLAVSAPAFADGPTADSLLTAINAKDAKTVASYVAKWPFQSYEVWFDEGACRDKFGGQAKVSKADFPAYVTCLADLKLTRDEPTRGYVTEPGMLVTPQFYQGHLRLIGGYLKLDDKSASIPPTALVPNFKTGALHIEPSAADKKRIDASKAHVFAVARFCVSTTGSTENVQAEQGGDASYGKTVVATVEKWSFKPFMRNGKAIRVCSRVPADYPVSTETPNLAIAPPPPPAPPAKK